MLWDDDDSSNNINDWSLEKLISITMKYMADTLMYNRMDQDQIKDEF